MRKIYMCIVIFILTIFSSFGQGDWTYDNLTTYKYSMGSTQLGPVAYFAGGVTSAGRIDEVEMYNTKTREWTYSNLAVTRNLTAGVSAGSKVFFAGGSDNQLGTYSTVDIYDTVIGQWTVHDLSVARLSISAVSKGPKVLFAGGGDIALNTEYDVVDIYDIEADTWTTTFLSEARSNMGSAVLGDQAFFAGGFSFSAKTASDKVDIYNFSTGTWTTANLSEPRYFIGVVAIGDKILFAGGMRSDGLPSSRVDIYNASTDAWSTASLSVARAFNEHESAASVCGKAYFVGGFIVNAETKMVTADFNVIDIYDEESGSWTVEFLPYNLFFQSTVAIDDKLLIAGGGTISGEFIQLRDVVRIYTCNIVGTDELVYRPEAFTIYPNPALSNFYITFADDYARAVITISDMAGVLVYRTTTTSAHEIEVSTDDFGEGVYVVQIQAADFIQSQKMIIVK